MPRTTDSSDTSHDFGTSVPAEIEVITESVEDGASNQEWAMARDEAYWEAERRIEAARQAGATELLEALAALTQLQELQQTAEQSKV